PAPFDSIASVAAAAPGSRLRPARAASARRPVCELPAPPARLTAPASPAEPCFASSLGWLRRLDSRVAMALLPNGAADVTLPPRYRQAFRKSCVKSGRKGDEWIHRGDRRDRRGLQILEAEQRGVRGERHDREAAAVAAGEERAVLAAEVGAGAAGGDQRGV